MNIANQLAAQQQEIVGMLGKMVTGFDGLSSSVEQLSDSMNKAADETEKQSDQEKKLADYQKKRERFQKKYDKELDRFAGVITLARKSQEQLNNLNKKYNAAMKASVKLIVGENTLRQKALKGMTMFKDAIGVVGAKLKSMSLGGAAGRAVGGIAGKLKGVLPMAAILSVPGLIVRQLFKVSTTMAELAKSTGLVGSNLKTVTNNVEQATAGLYAFGMNMEEVGRQAGALVDALGNASYVTEQLITNTSLIAKATGMSADEAANLTSTLIKGFDKTAPQVKDFADNMMSFASTSGVNARKVMRDIANDSNLTSIYLGRGEDYLMKSAVLAAKMGKSLAEQNQTLDAFSTIESALENVAEINAKTGANLDGQKMFMMFQTQDTLAAMHELRRAFSSPRAIAMIERYPGAFKSVASSLNLSVKDLKELDRVIADFEKSSMGASKQQQKIEDHIKAGMDILEQMKGIFFSAILPAFNNIGKMLVNTIKPTLNTITGQARIFGRTLSNAMDAEGTFGGKIKAMFVTIVQALQPAIVAVVDTIMNQIKRHFGSTIGFFFNDVPANAKGNVYNRPTLGLIGEEGRSEVVIPTERIRKGLPVNSSVAAELSSIGVPGFFAGGIGSGQASAAAINTAANTYTARQQQRAVLASQGDPVAVRRIEAKIEKQAAEVRKEQRALVNDIMSETLAMERQRYRDEGMGMGSGGSGGGRGGRGFSFRRFEKGLHGVLTGLDNFMMVTGTDFKDNVPEFFRKLPEKLQTGLTTGLETAYSVFLATGKLEDAVRAGAAAGVRAGVETAGPNTKVAGQIVADMLEGQSFRKSLGGVLTRAQNDPESRLNKTMEGLRKSAEVTEGMGAKAIGAASKSAGALGAIEGGIAAFQAGEGIQGIAKSGISQGIGQFSGKAIEGALMNTPLAPFAPILGQIGGGLIGKGVGKALGFLGLGGKRVSPAGARTKITDVIAGAMMGVTRPNDNQLSRFFQKGSPKHRILQANLAIAAARSPERLYNKIGDIMYDASGIRFSTDRVAQFTQALYQGNSGVIDGYEREMEGGISRAGASGAIVSRPTVALIGESGPEALMPLENAPGASPLNGVGGDGGALLQEIKRMNQMLGAMANRPITLDGQRVNAVLNAVNSDDIRAGIYTVNSR